MVDLTLVVETAVILNLIETNELTTRSGIG